MDGGEGGGVDGRLGGALALDRARLRASVTRLMSGKVLWVIVLCCSVVVILAAETFQAAHCHHTFATVCYSNAHRF